MSLKLVVCWIYLWITITDVSANYVVSNETIKWQNAKNRYNFATPKFQVDSSLFTVNITSNLKENEEAWVGYYIRETAFTYIGCGRMNNTNQTISLPISRNSPGLCYSMCNKSYQNYIGLNKGKCFCMSEIPSGDIYLSACNFSTNDTWLAGGEHEFMSIYERMKREMNVKRDPAKIGDCLAFEYSDHKYSFTWSGCNLPYETLCTKGGQVFILKHETQSYHAWRCYVQFCFEEASLPITYNDIISSSLVYTTGQKWLNVIRSDVIYKYKETSKSISWKPKRYGYITKGVNITVLSFIEDKSGLKRYLLQTTTDPTTKPTSDKSTMSQMSGKVTTNSMTQSTKSESQATDPTTKPTSDKSTMSQMSEKVTTNSMTQSTKSESQGSGVSVGVSVSVVFVVLVAAIVIIIILKRRGKIPSICIKIPALDKSSKRTSEKFPTKHNEYVESQETAYAQIDESKADSNVDARKYFELSNGHYAHTYFVLEPGTRESNTDVDISDPGKDNTDINDDYNTLHETVNARTKGNDTYDTTEKAALKVKTRQTAEDEQESPKMLNETEEDTYNRIDRSLLKNGKTDNIYGIPNCLENDYGDVGKSREKNLQDGDDTYNHVK